MRRVLAAAVVSMAVAGSASAQQALKPGTPSILMWSQDQQAHWYPAIETVYKVNTVKRGSHVHPLPVAAGAPLAPKWTFGGREWTIDDYMTANRISGLLVIKDGKILLEKYGLGRKPEERWTSFSVAKSVTSTLVGAAIQDGKIKGIDSLVVDYIPELKGSGYEGVTVRQLLMMSSGVKWNEDYTDPNSDVARAGATMPEPGVNPLVSYMRRLPRANEPGTKFTYNTGETDLVGVLVSKATGKTLSEYASEKLWKPYGMEQDAIWMTDLGGHERGGCCMSMTLRDYGRVGQFILDGGKAGTKQVLPEWWVGQATTPQITNGAPPPGYGYFWWMRPGGNYDASGIFGQSISTFRDDRLIIVQNAAWPKATDRDLSLGRAAMLTAVREAAKGR